MAAFFDYVRGVTDTLPEGYGEAGMRLYRHLVYLGVSQQLEAHFPAVRAALGDDDWRTLLHAYIRESRWDSPFYGDLPDDFLDFLARQGA